VDLVPGVAADDPARHTGLRVSGRDGERVAGAQV